MKSIDISAIDLNLLVVFEALFEERSVTIAAQRLHVGLPAMSAALGRLRTVFEDELFIRIGKEMQPTSIALEIAPGILAALELIRHTIESSQVFYPVSSQRSFTMGSPDYTSYVVIPPMLEFCNQKASGLNFRLIGYEKDATGEIDKALARLDLQRRIAITIPHMLVLPAIIAKNDLIAAIFYRVAARFASLHCLEIFELPVQTEPWAVRMLWSKLADKDAANSWLRQTLKTICEGI